MLNIPARGKLSATQLNVNFHRCANENNTPSSPLFLLPGGPGSNSTPFYDYLCLRQHIDLVCFDPRGCGNSAKGNISDYTLDNYIDDIEATRQLLGLKKISLLGKSYSGLVALGYALRYPQHVSSLLLVATGASYHFIDTAKRKLAEIGTMEQILVSQKLWEGKFTSTEEVSEYFQIMSSLYSVNNTIPESDPDELPFAYEPLNQGFLTDLRVIDYRAQLQQITCNTLVVTGDADWIFDVRYSKLIAERIPNAELKIYSNTGHFIELDVGNEYYQTISEFFKKTSM